MRDRRAERLTLWAAINDEVMIPSRPKSPERNLMVAIIERAVIDLRGHQEYYALAARRWFESSSLTEFSYQWICQALELDAEALYAVVRRQGFRPGSLRCYRAERAIGRKKMGRRKINS